MHGGDIVAKVLQTQGCTALFTLCGGHISPILAGAKKLAIRVVDVRHEASAVFAADSYARLTGIPGVAAVTAGPGVTNTITALKNAQLAQSPLILLGGATATALKNRGSLQDIDQIALVKPHVKTAFCLKSVKQIEPTLNMAFDIARSGVPGPVFIELPMDILYPESLVREWYGLKSEDQAAQGLQKKLVQTYLNFHTNKMFREAGAIDSAGQALLDASQQLKALGKLRPQYMDTAGKHDTLCKMLHAAKRPVLLIGSQATTKARDIKLLQHAVDTLQIPFFLSGMARGLMGKDHPLQFKHKRKDALRAADLVILAGVPCDFRLDYGNHIPHRAKLVSINLSAEQLTKNRRPSLGIQGHPGDFLIAFSNAGAPLEQDQIAPWLIQLSNRERERELEIEQQSAETSEHINPLALIKKIEALKDDNSIIVADGGDFVGTASYMLKPSAPLSWLDPGVFGTLGVGGGFTIGAATVKPDSEIWLIYGDGSSAYSLAEFDTYVRHGFAVIAVIGNDAAWNQIARDQVDFLGDDVGTTLRHTDYHKVAVGYGGEGILLDKAENIEKVLKKAKRLAKQGKPVVINAILDRSDFRKGSISV